MLRQFEGQAYYLLFSSKSTVLTTLFHRWSCQGEGHVTITALMVIKYSRWVSSIKLLNYGLCVVLVRVGRSCLYPEATWHQWWVVQVTIRSFLLLAIDSIPTTENKQGALPHTLNCFTNHKTYEDGHERCCTGGEWLRSLCKVDNCPDVLCRSKSILLRS